MDFPIIKGIFSKMDYIIRMANMDIDAYDIGDIEKEEVEREIKKAYLALKIWMLRLSSASSMELPTDDDSTEDYDPSNGVQIPLFSPDDYR